MQKAIWISYDLGVKGDYSNLYAWLDNHGAKECGDNIAFLKYEAATDDALLAALKREFSETLNLGKTNRIYVIFKNEGGLIKGRFLFGKRRAAPWQGYGNQVTEDDI